MNLMAKKRNALTAQTVTAPVLSQTRKETKSNVKLAEAKAALLWKMQNLTLTQLQAFARAVDASCI